MRHPVLGVAATIAVLFLISCTNSKGSFSLVNKTKEPIARASVAICGQTIELKDIQPNTSAVGSYEVKFDSHYTIQVEFQSGKTLQKEMGYVTNGVDFQHEIVVADSDIEITDTKVSRPPAR
jgi:transcription elongation factor Elf1